MPTNRLTGNAMLRFCLDCDAYTDDVVESGWNCAPEQAFGFLCPVCMGKRLDKSDELARVYGGFPLLDVPKPGPKRSHQIFAAALRKLWNYR